MGLLPASGPACVTARRRRFVGGDVDLGRHIVSITKSRDRGHDGVPKTRASWREVSLLPNVVAVLEGLTRGLDVLESSFVFRTTRERPIGDGEYWPTRAG